MKPSSKFLFLILSLAASFSVMYWWHLGQAVQLVDAPAEKLSCVSYSPFHYEGQTPLDSSLSISEAQIAADLSALSAQFACVRTYSVSQGLDVVPRLAQKLGMQVILGIWIGRNDIDNQKEIAIGAQLAQQYPTTIRALIMGNEVLLRREQTPKRLREYLQQIKHLTPVMPISYADSWDFWLRYQHELKDVVTFATVHILPFWDDDTVAVDKAADYVGATYRRIQAELHDLPVLIGETGWPSYGRQRQDAESSLLNQARFIREFAVLAQTHNIPYNIIEAFDQPWKRHSEGAVGGYWGMQTADGDSKFQLHGTVAEAPEWRTLAFAMMLLCCAVFLFKAWRKQQLYRSSIWVFLTLSITGAGASVSYWRDMLMTNRNALEWAYSGVYAVCLAGLIFLVGDAIGNWLINRQIPARNTSPQDWRLAEIIAAPIQSPHWLSILRFSFLFAATIVCLLLVFDLRNRDYPLALFAFPALGFSVVAWIKGEPDACLEEIIMATWIAVAGLWLPVIEHLIFQPDMSCRFADGLNPNVFYWTAICLGLAGSVLLPARCQLRPRQSQNA